MSCEKLSEELPGRFDIGAIVGDTITKLFSYTDLDGDPATEIADYDITSCYVLKDSVEYPFTTSRPATHQINIVLSSTQTTELGVGRFPWCLVWDEGSTTIRTAHSGTLILTARTP